MRYEFTKEYQAPLYERIKKRFDEYEKAKQKLDSLRDKCASLLIKKRQVLKDELLKENETFTPNRSFGKKSFKEFNYLQKTDVIDMNLKTNFNERLLNDIGNDLKEISTNVNETKKSLYQQGQTLNNVDRHIDTADNHVKHSNETISKISSGQRIKLILLNSIAILLFLAILMLLIIKFMMFGKN
jgi:hypothetical protein